MRPITGGTTNSPPYASTEISEAAAAELTRSRRPARLKRSGTTGESPAPGSAKAARQKTGFSQKQSIKPAAAAVRLPPVISTPLCEAPPQELADETADNDSGRKGGKGLCRRIQPGTCHPTRPMHLPLNTRRPP